MFTSRCGVVSVAMSVGRGLSQISSKNNSVWLFSFDVGEGGSSSRSGNISGCIIWLRGANWSNTGRRGSWSGAQRRGNWPGWVDRVGSGGWYASKL